MSPGNRGSEWGNEIVLISTVGLWLDGRLRRRLRRLLVAITVALTPLLGRSLGRRLLPACARLAPFS
jgi:hypothetical protein